MSVGLLFGTTRHILNNFSQFNHVLVSLYSNYIKQKTFSWHKTISAISRTSIPANACAY